jgi:hypothetical protein
MNKLPKVSEPLELIAPVPLQWEIVPDFNAAPPKCNIGIICNEGTAG